VAAARDPFPFLPRGNALLRRVLLAELLGPPRSRRQAQDDGPAEGGAPGARDSAAEAGPSTGGGWPTPRVSGQEP
jgi:hypothetical protein